MLAFEARRTWRSPLPWLLVAAAGALAAAAPYLAPDGPRGPAGWWAPTLVRHSQTAFVLPLLGTLLSVYTGWEAQRDRRTGAEEVFLGWPLAAWQWALARSLALGSVTLGVWLALAVPALVHALSSHGGAAGGDLSWVGPALRAAGIVAADLLASLAGAQALGQVAAALMPGTGGLTVLVLYRMFAVVGPGIAIGTLQWPFALLATPDLGTWYPQPWQPFSEAFGVQPHQVLFWTHRAFWSLGSPLAILALAFLQHRRREGPPWRSAVPGTLTLACALGTAVPFLSHAGARMAAYRATLAAYGEAVKPVLQVDPGGQVPGGANRGAGSGGRAASGEGGTGAPPVTPVRYAIEADLRSAPAAQLRAEVELLPRAPVGEIRFTLRRVFRVLEVTVDGRPLPAAAPPPPPAEAPPALPAGAGRAARVEPPPAAGSTTAGEGFAQQGDVVIVRLPHTAPAGRPLRVALTYAGRIADWRLAPHETPAALAEPGMVLVPATWGWYPVPGEHVLTSEAALTSLVYRTLVDRTRPFDATTPTFAVTVHAPPGVRTLAGFTPAGPETGGGTTWRLEARRNRVSLLGGDWRTVQRGGITYLVPPEEMDTGQEATADLHRLLTAALDWTGLDSLTVAPYPVPDPHILGIGYFGPVYQAAPDRERLAEGLRRWLRDEAPATWATLWDDRGPAPAPAADVWSLYTAAADYVVDRAAAEAFGEVPASDDGQRSEYRRRVEAWAARTPVEEQKRQLRGLFAAAWLRPLTEADFAFLGGGDPGDR